MLACAIVATVFGGVALLVGLIFLIPYRHLATRFDRSVTGRVVDLVWNAAKFNREQGHEPAELTGQVGSRRIRVSVTVGGRHQVVNPMPGTEGASVQNTINTFHKVYTYTVNGQTYTRADGVRYSRGLAEKWLGRDVTVYYDSAEPSRASLSQGRGFLLVSRILLPIGAALLALALWLWMQV